MAIYKIFPEKSATLYSYYPSLNTGLDEIMELSTFNSIVSSNEVSRGIIKFPTDEINDIILNKVSSSIFDVHLKLSLAYATELPLNYTLFCHPLAADWNVGTGRLGNSPITTDGVGWTWVDYVSGSEWFTSNIFPAGTTGSYRTGSNSGGGLWYTSSLYEATQSFTKTTSKEIDLKVTEIAKAWYSSSINNYGIILKHSSSLEFTSNSKLETKYFTGNTHTIYPPCLEIRWNDYIHSSSLSTVTANDIVATLGNNIGEFKQDSIQRFRVNVRDKFPVRTFNTASIYLNNKILPTSSYWSIKDLDTEEIVVDYDSVYTKISADNSGNYFDLYMNGLEPERYYQILIKTVLNNSTLVLDNNYYFKVKR